MIKKILYPKTTASLVINVSDPTKSPDDAQYKNTLDNVLVNLKGSLAQAEKSGDEFAGGNHIGLAGIQQEQDLTDKTAMEIIKALICPQYAPYYDGISRPSLKMKINGNTTRKWVGVEPVENADFLYEFEGVRIKCYNGNYSNTYSVEQTLNTPDVKITGPISVSGGLAYSALLVRITEVDGNPVESDYISVLGSGTAIRDVYGNDTNKIAPRAGVLIGDAPEENSSIVGHLDLGDGNFSEEYYLKGTTLTSGTATITYKYPDYIYATGVSDNEDVYESYCKNLDPHYGGMKAATDGEILSSKVYVANDGSNIHPLTIFARNNATLTYSQYEPAINAWSNFNITEIDNNNSYYFKPQSGEWVSCAQGDDGSVRFYKFTLVYNHSTYSDVNSAPLIIKVKQ